MFKKVLIITIFLEFIAVGFIGIQIFSKKVQNVKGISINPISSDYLVIGSEALEYFFEYKNSQVIEKDVGRDNTNGPLVPIYNINNDGLNQIADFPTEKPDNTFRIVAIGDSFTFGENVHTEDNYPSQLQDLLHSKCRENFEVFNLGIGGYDIQYAVERYRLRGQKYSPDLVLWFVIEDDFLRINEIMRPKMVQYDEEMIRSGDYEKELERGNFFPGWGRAQKEMLNDIGEEKLLNIQAGFMNKIDNYYSGKLLLFTFSHTEDKYKAVMADFANKRQGTFFYSSLPDIYSIHGASLPDQHPSPLGHELIAESILGHLIAEGLVPCVEF